MRGGCVINTTITSARTSRTVIVTTDYVPVCMCISSLLRPSSNNIENKLLCFVAAFLLCLHRSHKEKSVCVELYSRKDGLTH